MATAILDGVRDAEAKRQDADPWGERWIVDLAISRAGRAATVRTAWLIASADAAPCFLTCYVVIDEGD